MDRLEEIRLRWSSPHRPGHYTSEEIGWLIAEVDRLRAELAEWKGNYQTLLDGTSEHISRLDTALAAKEEELRLSEKLRHLAAGAHEISLAAFDTDDIGSADRGGEERG